MWGKKYLLFLFAVQLIQLYLERMKRVWQPRLEIRAKTAKTLVLGSSLSPSRPSAAILVSGRSDRARSSIFVHILFVWLVKLMKKYVRDKHEN